jgi:hypothetical protein
VWRYLKSAFFVSVNVPSLGRIPVNFLAVAAFVILGFAQPALWFLGLAFEAALVTGLAFNPRFQKVVEAQSLAKPEEDIEKQRNALVQLLEAGAQRRLWQMATKCNQVLQVYRTQQAEDYVIQANEHTLKNLEWLYLKLLVARHHLLTPSSETEQTLERKIDDLDQDIKDGEETESLLQSKIATLEILKQRLTTLRKRRQTLAEIEVDLTRVDNQVDLILENAMVQGKPQTISTDIELSSDLFTGSVFGSQESAISAIEQTYGQHKSSARKETA